MKNQLKINHTVIASAMPDSNNISRAEGFMLPDTSFLSSLLLLFRSDLYSRSLARSTPLMFGCKLLASRSIFRIYKSISTYIRIPLMQKKEGSFQTKLKRRRGYQSFCLIDSSLYIWNILLLLLCRLNKNETNHKTTCLSVHSSNMKW